MSQLIHAYIRSIQSEFDTGQSTEHSFRSALKTLLESLAPHVLALNESQRITGVGMPDFTIKDSKNTTINIGWIEAKDLYIDLDEKKNSDQLGRYLSAFDNFVYTNNLTFKFYRQGKLVESVSLGSATKAAISWNISDLFADNITKLERLLVDFLSQGGQTITSSEKLARAMAQKAQLIKYAIQTIFADEAEESALHHQYITFKDYLIHDLTTDQFADMYAQTIAYGLFAARLHDPTLPTFSREEAQTLIPKTTPFIRWLFKQMANDDEFDDRVAHIIDDLVHIFLHCNVDKILKTYNRETGRDDPIIHFYETFLGEYDSAMRKKRGVYYTPEPVVQFIVRGVDHILREDFGLKMGLADTSRVDHTFVEQGKKITKSVHRVQVLDPATGTGTFLDETVKYIHQTYFAGQAGIWKGYVTKDLLPRIRGFEILMASYTMAHLKMGLTIEQTLQDKNGGQGQAIQLADERFNIYLTNSLEQPHDNIGSLFSAQLARESEQASKVKTEQPIMVVMGNPPYSGESSNKGERIMSLMDDYKQEPGGKQKLQEQNSKRINDDYVKFIRFAESFVERNNEGIVAYICPHGFLDNPTFRGMRWKILSTFDTIYTVDLHGNSKKKEVSPDGSKDENVFDIQQGVAITFFVKTNKKKKSELATVYHTDVYGKRDSKYDWLNSKTLTSIEFSKLENVAPNYFMVQKDFGLQKKYDSFVSVGQLFTKSSIGIQSHRDELVVDIDKVKLIERIKNIFYNGKKDLNFILKESDSWNLDAAIKREKNINIDLFTEILYRPFDERYIYYSNNFVDRTRSNVGVNIVNKDNYVLNISKIVKVDWSHVFVTKSVSTAISLDINGSYFAPLYLYSEGLDGEQTRTPNLDMELVAQICDGLGMSWDADKGDAVDCRVASSLAPRNDENNRNIIGPVDILDYTYGLLHSPSYREMYAEFLKIDFPRVPFTTQPKIFWQMVALGRELRGYHLMETVDMSDIAAAGLQYPVDGDNLVEKPIFEPNPLLGSTEVSPLSGGIGKVYINSTQYIANVPLIAWEFYIGGYQPAQKRLKDRKDQTLTYDDIIHYQKIIVALTQTARVMEEIDRVFSL